MLASLLLGVGDYFGRYATRRSHALTTVIAMMVVGLAVSLVLVVVVPSTFTARDFGLGAGSGVLVGLALALVYAGMARSATAIVSPLVGVVSVAVPVVFDLITGDRPGRLQLVGFVVAVVSLIVTTFSPELGHRVWTGVLFGSGAGITFGASLILTGRTDIESGMWAAVGQRLVGAIFVVGLALAASQPRVLPRGVRGRGALAGVLGVSGVACFIAGAQRGSLAVVAVSGSMFPAVTVLMAVWFDDDILRWWQVIGIAGVLTGVGLIAAG
jgi:drug/metabolite transporter (DMT)-like permease